MVKIIVQYPEKCTGCRICELVCSLGHEGAINPEASRISVFRLNIATDIPIVCIHCAKTDKPSPCMEACPEEALIFDMESNLVKLKPDLCTGCGLCVENCPYGVHIHTNITGSKIYSEKARICDLCGGTPKCVEFCSSGAIKFEEAGKEHYEKMRSLFENYEGVV